MENLEKLESFQQKVERNWFKVFATIWVSMIIIIVIDGILK